jgi:hypothetical protein
MSDPVVDDAEEPWQFVVSAVLASLFAFLGAVAFVLVIFSGDKPKSNWQAFRCRFFAFLASVFSVLTSINFRGLRPFVNVHGALSIEIFGLGFVRPFGLFFFLSFLFAFQFLP